MFFCFWITISKRLRGFIIPVNFLLWLSCRTHWIGKSSKVRNRLLRIVISNLRNKSKFRWTQIWMCVGCNVYETSFPIYLTSKSVTNFPKCGFAEILICMSHFEHVVLYNLIYTKIKTPTHYLSQCQDTWRVRVTADVH